MGPAPKPEAQAPMPADAPASPAELLADAHSNLMQLMEIMGHSKAVSPEDKQMLAALIEGINQFAEAMGQAPGGAPKEAPARGNLPMEAGNKAVQPVL
jgi:hypothetical protein